MTNPILAFGAKQRMRSIRTPLLLTLYALAQLALALLTVYSPFLKSSINIISMRSSVLGYNLMILLQFGLLVLVAPAVTAGSICGERERQTLDLLLVTNTGAAQIVFGKLLESFAFVALLVLSSMPMLSLVVLTGGASFGQVMLSILFLLLTAFAGLSVGLFCSAFFKRTVSSTVAAYMLMLGIGVVTLVPLWYDVHQLDMLYRQIDQGGAAIEAIRNYQSIAFSLNPALGLFSLLTVQTGWLDNYIWSFSNTLGATMQYLSLERFLSVNLCFMAVTPLALSVLAALKLRVKKPKNGRG